tara:strand:+ start:736 stop:1116 length:381 start_codon:yes stop_codon:yes gene_type:complete
MTSFNPNCPHNKQIKCGIYNPSRCDKISIDPYFSDQIYENCFKFNYQIKLKKKIPPIYEPFSTLDEELSLMEEIADHYGEQLTERETNLIKKNRLEDLQEIYWETGKIYRELLNNLTKEIQDYENN